MEEERIAESMAGLSVWLRKHRPPPGPTLLRRNLSDLKCIKDTDEDDDQARAALRMAAAEASPGSQIPKGSPLAGDQSMQELDLGVSLEKEFARSYGKTTPLDDSSGSEESSRSIPHPKLLSERRFDDGATLVWRYVSVKMQARNGSSRKVIQSLTGYALPSLVTAIMGPPNSGKATLLNSLAGTLPSNAKVYGEILLNGRQCRPSYGAYAYVRRGGEFVETLTVREILSYSAAMQLPDSATDAEKISLVNGIIADMELDSFAPMLIGGCLHVSSLPPGERRRLSIAMQLITRPCLIFVEEPMLQLDNLSGFLVMGCLKKLACRGCTVVLTTQQVGVDILNLFDKICLLARGKALFFGETSACLEHFARAGFPCPHFQNPCEHFLQAVSRDFDRLISFKSMRQDLEEGIHPWNSMQISVMVRTLEAAYQASSEAAMVEDFVTKLSEKQGPMPKTLGQARFFAQLSATTWRSFLNMSRDFRFYWVRLILCAVLTCCIGTVYYKLEDSPASIHVKASATFFTVSFLPLMMIGGFPALVKELQVYYWEKKNGQTRPQLLVLGNMLSSIPFLFLISSICSVIGYFLMGFHPTLSMFIYYLIIIFLCLTLVEGLLMIIASIATKIFEGIMIAICIQVIFILVGGYFRELTNLPRLIWRYPTSYIAYQRYAVQGLLQNEYNGLRFSTFDTDEFPVQEALKHMSPVSFANGGKWFNMFILISMIISLKCTLYISLAIVEKVKSIY